MSKDPKNIVQLLYKIFDITSSCILSKGYHFFFDQWKRNTVEDASIVTWAMFENDFMGCLIPLELLEKKIRDFHTLSPESMNVYEYILKLAQISHYSLEMVLEMSRNFSLFVARLSRKQSKEGKESMLIGDMDIARLIIHVQQV